MDDVNVHYIYTYNIYIISILYKIGVCIGVTSTYYDISFNVLLLTKRTVILVMIY